VRVRTQHAEVFDTRTHARDDILAMVASVVVNAVFRRQHVVVETDMGQENARVKTGIPAISPVRIPSRRPLDNADALPARSH
jgi:hypothetical protein